jgi:hypothetical protein
LDQLVLLLQQQQSPRVSGLGGPEREVVRAGEKPREIPARAVSDFKPKRLSMPAPARRFLSRNSRKKCRSHRLSNRLPSESKMRLGASAIASTALHLSITLEPSQKIRPLSIPKSIPKNITKCEFVMLSAK